MSGGERGMLIANALGFQCVWFATIAGAGQGLAWAGPLAAGVFAAITLGLFGRARSDLGLIGVALPLGFILDSLWVQLGLLEFAQSSSGAWAPPWIVALWVAFALTVNHSLSGLLARPWLAAALGAAGGPLAYYAAERGFQAVTMTASTPVVLACIGLAWALTVPALLWLGSRLERRRAVLAQGIS